MNTILSKKTIADSTSLFVVEAPEIARKARPGQFVILRVVEEGERFPLTIADYDRSAGTITLVSLSIGASTLLLESLSEGDSLLDLAGPLGNPTHIEKVGTVVCVGGGVGIAAIHPVARGFKEAGNHVISIIGAKSCSKLLWEDKMAAASDELIVTTDDGTAGRQGFVTQRLQELIDAGRSIDVVFAAGPAIMMKMVAKVTQPYNIKTTVSLNPVMIDGTGMCGCCRVEVGGQQKFTCVDGPDFDGHQVDFDLLLARLSAYRDQEHVAWCKCRKHDKQ
ncbi:MAG TPA: sulfide/dihydroorotate dehydrogenase-like FAD/NAD-binding protein [Planctomycetota bacterium]|nr:sulfide/dihydroorotate dehydrogenase-like FAD/NAD-binding protein [Planctomycetota bacterium]